MMEHLGTENAFILAKVRTRCTEDEMRSWDAEHKEHEVRCRVILILPDLISLF